MTVTQATGATADRLPRIFLILAAVGLLAAANRYAPGVVQGVLLLVILYALLTNVPRALDLIAAPVSTLSRGFGRGGALGSGPGGPKKL